MSPPPVARQRAVEDLPRADLERMAGIMRDGRYAGNSRTYSSRSQANRHAARYKDALIDAGLIKTRELIRTRTWEDDDGWHFGLTYKRLR